MLRQQYDLHCQQWSDIREHVPVLAQFAKHAAHVTEIGLRDTIPATWGLVFGLSHTATGEEKKTYVGIGAKCPAAAGWQPLQTAAKEHGIAVHFREGKELTMDMDATDLLFIDGLHTYCHVTATLDRFHSQVNRYICLHDTSEPWGNADDSTYHGDYKEYPDTIDRKKRGVWPAIEDFLRRQARLWLLVERRVNCFGLVVLRKRSTPELMMLSQASTRPVKVLVLIISDDHLSVYKHCRLIWRRYMHRHASVVCKFVAGNAALSSEAMEEGDTLWVKCNDTYIPGILDKTIRALQYYLQHANPPFDLVFRTNLSSFLVWDKLLHELSTPPAVCLPGQALYMGYPLHSDGVNYCSGCGFVMSRATAALLCAKKNELTLGLYDDVAIGQVLERAGVSITSFSAARRDFIENRLDLDIPTLPIPESTFHFRVRNDSDRAMIDALILQDLLRRFYPPTEKDDHAITLVLDAVNPIESLWTQLATQRNDVHMVLLTSTPSSCTKAEAMAIITSLASNQNNIIFSLETQDLVKSGESNVQHHTYTSLAPLLTKQQHLLMSSAAVVIAAEHAELVLILSFFETRQYQGLLVVRDNALATTSRVERIMSTPYHLLLMNAQRRLTVRYSSAQAA